MGIDPGGDVTCVWIQRRESPADIEECKETGEEDGCGEDDEQIFGKEK